LRESEELFADPNGTPYRFAYSEGHITRENGEQE
jgi:hypothetical protein